MDAIRIEHLTKRYKDVTAVDDLSLCIREGELFSLLGVNGAGKSTTIRMLCGLSAPNGGDAFILGHSMVTDTRAAKSLIGISPQETAVAPKLTVRENLELMCGACGFNRADARGKSAAMMEAFHLKDIAVRKAGKLSGGWQRRLSIAMALIGEPKVLFLDEPTLGLDVLARNDLWDQIRTLKGRMTIILTSHYMEESEALADRIGIMKDGHLIALGTVEELKKQAGTDRFDEAFVRIVREVTP